MPTRPFPLMLALALAVLLAHPALAPLPVEAQAPTALTGEVISGDGGAMEGVLVSARKVGSTITVTVVSDAQGRYRFPASKLDPGRYELGIRAVGFELDGPRAVDLAPRTLTVLDLKLRKVQDLAKQLTNAEWLMSMPGAHTEKTVLLGCVQCHTLERVVRSPHDAPAFLQVIQRMGTYTNQSTPLHIQTRRAERLLEMRGEERQRARRTFTEYLLPRQTNIRVFVDNSTTPPTFWVGNNHGASVMKLEPLD